MAKGIYDERERLGSFDIPKDGRERLLDFGTEPEAPLPNEVQSLQMSANQNIGAVNTQYAEPLQAGAIPSIGAVDTQYDVPVDPNLPADTSGKLPASGVPLGVPRMPSEPPQSPDLGVIMDEIPKAPQVDMRDWRTNRQKLKVRDRLEELEIDAFNMIESGRSSMSLHAAGTVSWKEGRQKANAGMNMLRDIRRTGFALANQPNLTEARLNLAGFQAQQPAVESGLGAFKDIRKAQWDAYSKEREDYYGALGNKYLENAQTAAIKAQAGLIKQARQDKIDAARDERTQENLDATEAIRASIRSERLKKLHTQTSEALHNLVIGGNRAEGMEPAARLQKIEDIAKVINLSPNRVQNAIIEAKGGPDEQLTEDAMQSKPMRELETEIARRIAGRFAGAKTPTAVIGIMNSLGLKAETFAAFEAGQKTRELAEDLELPQEPINPTSSLWFENPDYYASKVLVNQYTLGHNASQLKKYDAEDAKNAMIHAMYFEFEPIFLELSSQARDGDQEALQKFTALHDKYNRSVKILANRWDSKKLERHFPRFLKESIEIFEDLKSISGAIPTTSERGGGTRSQRDTSIRDLPS